MTMTEERAEELKKVAEDLAPILLTVMNQDGGTYSVTLAKLVEDAVKVEFGKGFDSSELARQLDTLMAQRHPPGLCKKADCQTCKDFRGAVRLETLERIEECVPGTQEKLAAWELRNQTITIKE